MAFRYEFELNGLKLKNIELGSFSTHRKWEEALDTLKVTLPFYTNESPISQLGLLRIRIDELNDLNVEVETRFLEYLVISDNVTPSTKYGNAYRHEITGIEYTAKLDYYISNSLAFTRPTENNLPPPFEIMDNRFISDDGIIAYFGVFMEMFNLKSVYKVGERIEIPRVDLAYQSLGFAFNSTSPFRRAECYVESNLPDGTKQILTSADALFRIEYAGDYYIDYGIRADGFKDLPFGDYLIYRYYIKVVDEAFYTMYDLLNSVRNSISKYGTIETKDYHDATRLFEIDPLISDYLKGIQAPQMYLGQATVRQTLNYLLSYVNAISRLNYNNNDVDVLTIEKFNENNGTFELNDVIGSSSNQNTNQIGTRTYSTLKQILPNDLNEPNIISPSTNEFATVRSADIQLTDGNFELKLPSGHSLYMPTKLEILIPRYIFRGGYLNDPYEVIYTNTIEDLTARLINIEEWKLKKITPNFPSANISRLGNNTVGLRENLIDNLYWQVGDNSIKLSDSFGTVFLQNLIEGVYNGAIVERITRNGFEPQIVQEITERVVNLYSVTIDTIDFKDLKFRVSYISLEDLNIKQDKEDLSQIDFYSEMRNNQDEQIVNVSRQSRKSYGNLQRTGNKQFTFTKIHKTLSSIYKEGAKDKNNFTITDVYLEYYNDYILATYSVTKNHNRISQATFVDQTYRWRDNYTKSALDRHENYVDYLMILPKDDLTVIDNESVLLTGKNNVEQTIFTTLRSGFLRPNTKATTALVRTDGMFKVYNETTNDRKALMIPVSSYGIKQGFAFTLGFQDNQIAGDGLVQKDGNWYNQAVRYTDTFGTFNEFAFAILSDKVFLSSEQSNYETYPLINATSLGNLFGFNGITYADNIDSPSLNVSGENPFIVKKDVMTNFKLTYQVQVMSYYEDLYILGQKFYNENFIVDNNEQYGDTRNVYIYLYNNGQEFEKFNDLVVPNGYYTRILLTNTNLIYTIVVEFNQINFVGINLTGVTSWAIGNENKDLFLACNEGLNGFKIVRRHFRPNVREIGKGNTRYVDESINSIAESNVRITYRYIQYYSAFISSVAESNVSISYNVVYNQPTNISSVVQSEVSIGYTSMRKTANPTITAVSVIRVAGINTITWTVTNNDGSTATILSDTNTVPFNNRGNVGSGASIVLSEISLGTEIAISAQATAVGKLPSDIVLYYL